MEQQEASTASKQEKERQEEWPDKKYNEEITIRLLITIKGYILGLIRNDRMTYLKPREEPLIQ